MPAWGSSCHSRDSDVSCGGASGILGESIPQNGIVRFASSPDFNAENLTIENAFDPAANATKSDSDVTKMRTSQGVARGWDRIVVRRFGWDVDVVRTSDARFYLLCWQSRIRRDVK
jgi:hypothetical protein